MLIPQFKVFGAEHDLQRPFDAAVVMPTLGRPEIVAAVESVYRQTNVRRLQLLIGIDKPLYALDPLMEVLECAPDHVTPCLFYPGYSTSVRHGGVHEAKDGGAIRSILTLSANARYVCYLDDDNWWDPRHVSVLIGVITGRHWAFSRRWFVHPETRRTICADEWESVGPNRGGFAKIFGGFVDPNCLMIDKLSCWQAIPLWNMPLQGDAKGMSADRNVFNFLRGHGEPGMTEIPTVFYVIDPRDAIHDMRLQMMGERYAAAGRGHVVPAAGAG